MPRSPAGSPPGPAQPLFNADEAAELLREVNKGRYGPPTGPKAREIINKIRAAQTANQIKVEAG